MTTYRLCNDCRKWRNLNKQYYCDCKHEEVKTSKSFNINIFDCYDSMDFNGRLEKVRGRKQENRLCEKYGKSRVLDHKTTWNNPKNITGYKPPENAGLSVGFQKKG